MARAILVWAAIVSARVSDDKPAVRQKAYVHVAEAGAPHYRETTHALSRTATRDLVLKRAWAELQAWKRRYADLKEFSGLIGVIDEIERDLPKIGRK